MVRAATAQTHVQNRVAMLDGRIRTVAIALVHVLTSTMAVERGRGVLAAGHTARSLASPVGLWRVVQVAVGVRVAAPTIARLRVCIMRILVVV